MSHTFEYSPVGGDGDGGTTRSPQPETPHAGFFQKHRGTVVSAALVAALIGAKVTESPIEKGVTGFAQETTQDVPVLGEITSAVVDYLSDDVEVGSAGPAVYSLPQIGQDTGRSEQPEQSESAASATATTSPATTSASSSSPSSSETTSPTPAADPALTLPELIPSEQYLPRMLGSVVQVDTAEELSVALRDAVPCQRIVVAPGEYKKNTDTDVEEELQFVLDGPGQSNCPIIVDAKGAVLVGEGYNTPVLSLLDADYVILNDFSSVGGTNGISSELSDRAFVSVDQIRDTGFEAIVPFNFTQNMTIDLQSGSIHETGKVDPARGEAIYIGSGMPDAAGNIDQSSGNVIMGNMPAAQDPASPAEAPRNIYGTAAEAVEIGPGVRDTRIEWLQIDAAAMTGANACITDAGENTSISGVTCAAVPVESDIVRVRTDPAVVGSGEGVFVSDIALNGTLSPGRFYVAIEAAIQKRTVHCVPGMAPEVPYSNIPCVPDAEQSAG